MKTAGFVGARIPGLENRVREILKVLNVDRIVYDPMMFYFLKRSNILFVDSEVLRDGLQEIGIYSTYINVTEIIKEKRDIVKVIEIVRSISEYNFLTQDFDIVITDEFKESNFEEIKRRFPEKPIEVLYIPPIDEEGIVLSENEILMTRNEFEVSSKNKGKIIKIK